MEVKMQTCRNVEAGQNPKHNTLGTGRGRGEAGGRGESMGKSEKDWLPMPEEDQEGAVLWKPGRGRPQGHTGSNADKGSGWKGTEKYPGDSVTRTVVLLMRAVSVRTSCSF